jgi:outer membrane receptor protein involved in Fe transport
LDKLGLTWEMDHQTSQEFAQLGDPDTALLNDPDNRDPKLLTTGAFTTHDFSLRYDLTDEVRLRAGVVNAFDAEPNLQTELFAGANVDQFDLFGRRFFVGATLRLGRP